MSFIKNLYAFISDTVSVPLRADYTTNTLQTIDYSHHEIHSGSTFRVQAFDDAVASGSTLAIGFKTGNTSDKYMHFIFEWEVESYATLELIEGATITASTGTDVLIKNSRRPSSKTSEAQGYATGSWVANYVTKNPTHTGGDVVSMKKSYTDNRAGGGSGSRRAEIILKADTEYVIEVTNDDTGAHGIQIRLEWYEHTDKN